MLRRVFCKLLLVAVVIFSLLALSGAVMAQGRSEEAFEHVKEVQERSTLKLMAKPGVVGTAVGLNDKGRHDVIVLLENDKVPGIPQELEDVPVRRIVSGKIYAYIDRTARQPRPVPIGVSTGHPAITAGTIGCRVYDDEDGDGIRDFDEPVFALSNNHVYADENLASIGDAVIQPGTYDGGSSHADDIGTLADFEEIKFDGTTNIIDAAIANTTTALVGKATPSDGYGSPKSTTVIPGLLQSVQKYGRTTGLTSGMVFGTNTAVNVQYSSGNTAYYENQIMIYGNFSAGGDSGSLVVTDPGKEPVGLLFAGGGAYTFANPIGPVLSRFGVKIDGGSEGPVNNPPAVDITNPANNAIVSGMVNVTADATGDNGVTQVEFFVDTASIGVDTRAPYGITWDSTTVADGLYMITAVTTDATEQTASDSIMVVVFNVNSVPVVAITNPFDGTKFTSGSSILFEGIANDVEDGDLTDSIDWISSIDGLIGTGGSFSTILKDGSHTITAEVTDSGGESGSYSITVTVEATPVNELPTVTITSPANGSTFDSGASIFFEGTANDTEDGDLTASINWTSSINSPIGTGGSFYANLNKGSHTITAEVTDSGGKTRRDSITITVETPSEEPPTVSVDSITVTTVKVEKGQKVGQAVVVIVDNLGDPIEGALVQGNFSEDFNESAGVTTDESGIAVFTTSSTAKGRCHLTFCVDYILHDFAYSPGGNIETCDSNY